MLPCLFKKYLGIDCPGCGLQRSFLEFCQGNFAGSFDLFPALIPSLLTMGLLLVYLVLKKEWLLKLLVLFFMGTAAIMTISYVIRIVEINSQLKIQ